LASSGASSRRRIVQLEELVTDLLNAAAAAPTVTIYFLVYSYFCLASPSLVLS
jgi:hypothetical protein